MRLHDTPELKWMTLSVLLIVLMLKYYLDPTDMMGLAISMAAVGVFGIVLVLLMTNLPRPEVFWNKERNLVAILRPWTVEVCSARLLSSVPIGIDLSHSGTRVLRAMYTRYLDKAGGAVVFFIARPMGNQSTRIGFLVRRRGLRLWNGMQQVDRLAKKLVPDIMILERAMRAAYPHLPVKEAEFDDILKVTTGGLETYAVA
ncbi:MAG: hypothetical protein E4H14_07840 [Candidatus Thorarchaeota archaeon]|nr:MAG: hypothetical protein E4H14_07840 [Candidatus Thorarchaeota archaeon]